MEVTGRTRFTTLLVQYKLDNRTEVWKDVFERAISTSVACSSESIQWRHQQWSRFSAAWFFVLADDRWAEEKLLRVKLEWEEQQKQQKQDQDGEDQS